VVRRRVSWRGEDHSLHQSAVPRAAASFRSSIRVRELRELREPRPDPSALLAASWSGVILPTGWCLHVQARAGSRRLRLRLLHPVVGLALRDERGEQLAYRAPSWLTACSFSLPVDVLAYRVDTLPCDPSRDRSLAVAEVCRRGPSTGRIPAANIYRNQGLTTVRPVGIVRTSDPVLPVGGRILPPESTSTRGCEDGRTRVRHALVTHGDV
jgi:hypothetical protein